MTGSGKRKGDRAEREVVEIIRDLTGWPAKRAFGAGRGNDEGDVIGVPSTTVQVASWDDVRAAAVAKPRQAEQQRQNAAQPFACTWVRFRGGEYRIVLTPEQWHAIWREALS